MHALIADENNGLGEKAMKTPIITVLRGANPAVVRAWIDGAALIRRVCLNGLSCNGTDSFLTYCRGRARVAGGEG